MIYYLEVNKLHKLHSKKNSKTALWGNENVALHNEAALLFEDTRSPALKKNIKKKRRQNQ